MVECWQPRAGNSAGALDGSDDFYITAAVGAGRLPNWREKHL